MNLTPRWNAADKFRSAPMLRGLLVIALTALGTATGAPAGARRGLAARRTDLRVVIND